MHHQPFSSLGCRFVAGWRVAIALIALGGAAGAHATTVVPPEFNTLVNDSDYIIHAVTKNVTAEKRAGAHGVKIVTRVELEVIEVVAGNPPGKVITLEMLGGQVGRETLRVEGMPRFHVGDEDILFVRGNGQTICPLYGMMHGRYFVEKDPSTGRKFVARSNGVPLQATAQIASPMMENGAATAAVQSTPTPSTALEPAEFIRQIRSSIKPEARLNRAK